MITDDAAEAAVDRIAELLDRRIGLRAEPALQGRLRRCIREDATELGQDLDAYVQRLSGNSGSLQSLLNRVTVQETGFFRHPEQFDVLANEILPTLDRPVRIWSAGCANGQEAFSLAMVLEERGIPGSILATDLSTDALRRTASARYTTRELRGLSPSRLSRHLIPAGPDWQISKAARDRVTTLHHNLLDPPPSYVRTCQVVFCRNVLIYFTPRHATEFLDRLADTLPVGAYLVLGSAESLWHVTDRFQALRVLDTFVYRRHERVHEAPTAIIGAQHRTGRRKPVPRPGRTAPSPRTSRPIVLPQDPSIGMPTASVLARAGQAALREGDHTTAVIAFRKWAYLVPGDALAHFHLGLALESAGDHPSAHRAFSAARIALLHADPAHVEDALEGYTAGELLRLLDTKRRVIPR